MALLSIPSYKTDDPNYRYKMPRLVAKVEGRGNGIRTNIVNMGDIARALKRPPDYPTRFCGSELGAQCKFDPAEGKAIVTGAHEQHDLQSLIDKFIQKYVLCPQCDLPEIDLIVKKGKVQYQCNACGDKGDSDNVHKLATYITKNPPGGAVSTIGGKKKLSKEERRLLKAAGKQQTSEEHEVKSKKKNGSKKKSSADEDDDGSVIGNNSSDDMAEQKSKSKPIKKKHDHVLVEVDQSNDEELLYTHEDVLNCIHRLLRYVCQQEEEEQQDSWAIDTKNITPLQFSEQLRLVQISQNFDHTLKFYIALEVLYGERLQGLSAITLEERIAYLKPVATYTTAKDILTALQDFMYIHANSNIIPEGYKAYAGILYAFYDHELIGGDDVLKYYSSSKYPKRLAKHQPDADKAYTAAYEAAQPILEWLAKDGGL